MSGIFLKVFHMSTRAGGVILAAILAVTVCFRADPEAVYASEGREEEEETAEESEEETDTEETSQEFSLVPTQADLEGVHAGYFFIPIDGSVYRYQNGDRHERAGTHAGELIYACTEEGLFENWDWKIYSVEEFPGYDVLMAVREAKEDLPSETFWLTYAPALQVPERDIEEVGESGFVVMKNGSAVSGKELWSDFVAKTQAGEKAAVRLANTYDRTGNMSEELREATQEDYPSLFLSELSFDGEGYTLSPLHKIDGSYVICEVPGYDNPVTTYRYLMHYTGEPRLSSALYTHYDRYVLTDRDDVTWQDIEWGMLSSQFDAYIPHAIVYNEYELK